MAEIPVSMNGRYAKVNTVISSSDSYLINGLNGRQGDNGRRVYLQFYDGEFPHDLTGETIELQGKDVQGKTKTSVSLESVFSAKAGTCSFLIPGAFYQAAGPYQNAYFVIKKADTGQAVSTIPVSMTVMENAVFMTTGESKIWLGEYQDEVKQFADLVKKWVEGSGDQIKANQALIDNAQAAINNMLSQIHDNHLAQADKDNDFSGVNTFSGITNLNGATHIKEAEIDKLSGGAYQSLLTYISNALKSADDPEAGKKYSNFKVWGVNGCRAHDDVHCELVKFNKHAGYCFIEGTFDFPPMKPYEQREVINVDQAAMNGGEVAMPRLVSVNADNILYFSYNSGDSGHIWMDHQGDGYDQSKPDPEFIQIGWLCTW